MITITDFARMGGLARWKGVSKGKRKAAMKKIAMRPRKKLSTAPSKHAVAINEQAR